MRMFAFSVLDKAVGAFMVPFFCRSDGEAMRSFSDAVLDPKHQFHAHSADYDLYNVGIWDDSVGGLAGSDPAKVVSGVAISGTLVNTA